MRAWLLCIVLSCAACESTLSNVYGGFVVENPAFCETSTSCIGKNSGEGPEWICDTLLHACLPPDTCLSGSHSCQNADRPICTEGLCVPCSSDGQQGDTECQSRTEQRRDNRHVCIGGACKECRGASDCPTDRPVCAGQSCRACREHAECASGVCRSDEALREDAAAVGGTCVDESQIVYVDSEQPMSGTGTTQSPMATVADALAIGKPFLSLRPSRTGYGALSLNNRKQIVVGQRNGSQLPVITAASVSSGSLVLSQVAIVPAIGQDGALCGTQAELIVRNTSISGPSAAARGVVADAGCLRVDVHASRFSGIQGSAIFLPSGSTTYRIVNSAFRSCGSTNPKFGSAAVYLGQGTRGVFTYNTLYQNLDAIECGNGQRIENSVAVGGSLPGCSVDRPDLGADLNPDQLQLQDTPRNHACCIDQATPDPSVSTDSQGTSRPQSAGPDRGYWEG